MTQTGEGKKIVTTSDTKTEIDALIESAEKLHPAPKAKVVTTPRWFIRHTRAGGKEYQQLCRHVYVSSKRRLQVAKVTWPTAALLALGLFLGGCSATPLPLPIQELKSADQSNAKAIQQQGAAITKLTADMATAQADNAKLKAQLATFATKDDLKGQTATPAPPANSTDLLNRLSVAEGKLINLGSQSATLQAQVTAAIKSNQDYISTTLRDKYASKADFATLQGRLDNLSAPAVAQIVSQMSELSARLLSAQQLITNLQTYGSQLQQIQTQINGIQSMANTVGALGNEVSALNSTVSSLQAAQSPAALIAAIQARVDSAAAQVAAMQTQVNLDQGNITLLQGMVATMAGQITDIQNRLLSHGW